MHPPSITQLLIILLIIVLLFGAKKIPELAKGLGSGIKNFKKAVKEDEEDNQSEENTNNDNINMDCEILEKLETGEYVCFRTMSFYMVLKH